ncbi:hypothetical protein [Marinactinospora rubrisoli]|uniref:Uncharacterized protein n=1 Tax=Marinactinospora rubrisoli TaxID=2715399 RepID=A0ABW2KEB1_9ACTN
MGEKRKGIKEAFKARFNPDMPEMPQPSSTSAPLSGDDARRAVRGAPARNLQQAIDNSLQTGESNIERTGGRRPGQSFRQMRRNNSKPPTA